MKTRLRLAALFLGLAGMVPGCSDDEESTPPGTGGSAGASGASGRGGSSGSAGSAGRGGGSGNGGMAGSAGTGGSAGSAGTAGSSGSAGTGGTNTTDGGDAGDGGTPLTESSGVWLVYPDPYADGGANPITSSIMGKAQAFAAGAGTRLTLSVTGLPPNRMFGAHLHKLDCNDNKAGGHYQNNPFPDGGSATDPTYANSTNEAWLDFHTDANGAGSATATVAWRPRAGQAKAVVIHTMMTMDGGVAGAKLACTNIAF